MTIHAVNYNMQVENVVATYRDRPDGSVSKLNTFSDGMKVIKKMFTLYKNYRPFNFFGLIALVLALIAIGLMVPIVIEYFETGLVPRFPTLIASGFIGIAGVQSFFTGFMLSVINSKDIKDFEYRFTRVHDHKKSIMKEKDL